MATDTAMASDEVTPSMSGDQNEVVTIPLEDEDDVLFVSSTVGTRGTEASPLTVSDDEEDSDIEVVKVEPGTNKAEDDGKPACAKGQPDEVKVTSGSSCSRTDVKADEDKAFAGSSGTSGGVMDTLLQTSLLSGNSKLDCLCDILDIATFGCTNPTCGKASSLKNSASSASVDVLNLSSDSDQSLPKPSTSAATEPIDLTKHSTSKKKLSLYVPTVLAPNVDVLTPGSGTVDNNDKDKCGAVTTVSMSSGSTTEVQPSDDLPLLTCMTKSDSRRRRRRSTLKDEERAKRQRVSHSVDELEFMLNTCSVCKKWNENLALCSDGHSWCKECLEIEVRLHFSQKKQSRLKCGVPGCGDLFLSGELQKVLPALLADVLEAGPSGRGDLLDLSVSDVDDDDDEDDDDDDCSELGDLFPTLDPMLPPHWDRMDKDENFRLVEIPQSYLEYKEVERAFHLTMSTPRAQITRLLRVQNPILWQLYSVRCKQLTQELGQEDINEFKLFHGTKSNFINAICRDNFDWRVCGVNGTAFGQGTYFARDASYSHRFTDPQRPPSAFMSVQRNLFLGQPVAAHSSGVTLSDRHNQIMVQHYSSSSSSLRNHLFGVFSSTLRGTVSLNSYPSWPGGQNWSSAGTTSTSGLYPAVPSTSSADLQSTVRNDTNLNGATEQNSKSTSGQSYSVWSPSTNEMVEGQHIHKMFYARVLCGLYAKGQPKYRKPPARDPSLPYDKCFNSCVDSVHQPQVYVIFDRDQCYPEYLIEYSNEPRWSLTSL